MKLASHPRFWFISGLVVFDGLFFGLSDPARVPSLLLAAGFVLMAVTLYQLFRGLLKAADWYGLPGKAHRHRQARILTGLVAGLIALQSIGELGERDVLVLLPLAVIAYLYISYGKGRASREVAVSPATISGNTY